MPYLVIPGFMETSFVFSEMKHVDGEENTRILITGLYLVFSHRKLDAYISSAMVVCLSVTVVEAVDGSS
jgi:hypothetical protein